MGVMFSITESPTHPASKVSETFSEDLDEAQTKLRVTRWVREIAGVRGLTESRDQMFRRVASAVRLPVARVQNIFYGEARRIDAFEYLRIERAAKRSLELWKNYRVPFPSRR